MSPRKFTFIMVAFMLGLLVHVCSTASFFMSKTSSNSYFSLGLTLTFVYLFLAAISFAITVIIPAELEKKQPGSTESSINWWWHIYLGGWTLAVLIGLEYYFLSLLSLKIGFELDHYTLFFFFIKSLFLIPAYFLERKNNRRRFLALVLGFLEIFLILAFFGLLWMAGQTVPDFGS